MPREGIRPHTWITGTDVTRHHQYGVWLQQRNQALYRGEGWHLDFDCWIQLWGELWSQRGRRSHHYCMTRTDPDGPWQVDNVEILSRPEHLKRHRERQMANRRLRQLG